MFGLFKKLSDNPIELYQNIENGKQEKASFKKLEELTNDRNAVASYFLALCYACGQVVNEDRNMFVKYLLKSAEGNYPIALARLGDCYYYGEDLEKDCKKGIEYYEKTIAISEAMDKTTATQNGVDEGFISDIHYDLFRSYHSSGDGFEKNMDNAYYHLEKASKCNRRALLELAIWNLNGYYIKQDRDKAIKCFRKLAYDEDAIAIEEYDTEQDIAETWDIIGEANYYLGLCFENGYGTSVDMKNAKYWYGKSADLENEKAIKRLKELTD